MAPGSPIFLELQLSLELRLVPYERRKRFGYVEKALDFFRVKLNGKTSNMYSEFAF